MAMAYRSTSMMPPDRTPIQGFGLAFLAFMKVVREMSWAYS